MDLLNKQFWLNNLWFGENSREQNRAEFFDGLTFNQRAAVLTLTMPDGSKIWGVDLSHWNLPPVNIKRMVDEFGMSFVIIKGCDGSLNTRYYFEHVAEAKRAGIPWGMYVWLYASKNVSIDSQTNAWVARYNVDPPPMGIFIDAETTRYGGVVSNPNGNDLRAAHDKVKSKTGKPATTYTAKYFADANLKGFDFMKEELWVANYGVSAPLLPNGAPTYTIHQFTATLDGKTLDSNGNFELDGNYYKDAELFRQRFGGEVPPPPDPPTEPPVEPPGEPMPTVTTYHLTVTATPAKRWSDAACTNRIYPDIPNGTKLESQIKSGSNYYIGNGYVKGSQVHLDYVETVEEPTEPPVEPPVEPPPTTNLPETLKGFDATGTEIPGAVWDKRDAP